MFPLLQAVEGAVGLGQSIAGGIQAHKAQKQLEGMADSYKPNSSLLDYYNKALSQYNADPYSSAMYRRASGEAQRGLATGVTAFQDRRSALAGLPSLLRATNDAQLKAAATAEGQQGEQLSRLGNAAQVKAAEEFKPFEMRWNLQAQKAAGGNQVMNAGMSNLFNAGQSAADAALAKKIYGG